MSPISVAISRVGQSGPKVARESSVGKAGAFHRVLSAKASRVTLRPHAQGRLKTSTGRAHKNTRTTGAHPVSHAKKDGRPKGDSTLPALGQRLPVPPVVPPQVTPAESQGAKKGGHQAGYGQDAKTQAVTIPTKNMKALSGSAAARFKNPLTVPQGPPGKTIGAIMRVTVKGVAPSSKSPVPEPGAESKVPKMAHASLTGPITGDGSKVVTLARSPSPAQIPHIKTAGGQKTAVPASTVPPSRANTVTVPPAPATSPVPPAERQFFGAHVPPSVHQADQNTPATPPAGWKIQPLNTHNADGVRWSTWTIRPPAANGPPMKMELIQQGSSLKANLTVSTSSLGLIDTIPTSLPNHAVHLPEGVLTLHFSVMAHNGGKGPGDQPNPNPHPPGGELAQVYGGRVGASTPAWMETGTEAAELSFSGVDYRA